MKREYFIDTKNEIDADFVVIASGLEGLRINDGDSVFCKSGVMPDNGDLAALIIDEQILLKQFFLYGDLVVLRAPGCKDLEFPVEERNRIGILGKAVGFQSLF